MVFIIDMHYTCMMNRVMFLLVSCIGSNSLIFLDSNQKSPFVKLGNFKMKS